MKILPARIQGPYTVITVEGSVDLNGVRELDHHLKTQMLRPDRNLVLQFVHTETIHTALVAVLIKAQQVLSSNENKLVLCCVPFEFHFLLQLTKLDQSLDFRDSLDFLPPEEEFPPTDRVVSLPLSESKPVIYKVPTSWEPGV